MNNSNEMYDEESFSIIRNDLDRCFNNVKVLSDNITVGFKCGNLDNGMDIVFPYKK